MLERTFSLTYGLWYVFEVRDQDLLRHFEVCAPQDLLRFSEPETPRSTKFAASGEFLRRIERDGRS